MSKVFLISHPKNDVEQKKNTGKYIDYPVKKGCSQDLIHYIQNVSPINANYLTKFMPLLIRHKKETYNIYIQHTWGCCVCAWKVSLRWEVEASRQLRSICSLCTLVLFFVIDIWETFLTELSS